MTEHIRTVQSRETLIAAHIAYAKIRALRAKGWEDLQYIEQLCLKDGIDLGLSGGELAQIEEVYQQEYKSLTEINQ